MKHRRKATLIALCLLLAALPLTAACGARDEFPVAVGDGEYCIAMISDTQFYSQRLPEYFERMTQFLADNRERLNLQYVVHTGDIVNAPYETEQWEAADKAMALLGDIPVGVLPGNHDTGNGEDRYKDYRQYFGTQRYENCAWYGGGHEGNRGHYDLMSMGGRDFVIVYLSDDPSKCCIDFANEVFAQYSERIGVLCTHKYIDSDGTLSDMGDYMQKKILAQNENVRLVLCGHNSITGYLTSELDNADGGKRRVQQIIANYQDNRNNGGNGYMLFIIVNEKAGTLNCVTYSPITGDHTGHDDEVSIDNFTIDITW